MTMLHFMLAILALAVVCGTVENTRKAREWRAFCRRVERERRTVCHPAVKDARRAA